MSALAIEVHDLRMRYGAEEAVRGIDLEVVRGEVFGFLGPNGAGKTTTIEILEGYRERTSGRVAVLGVDPAAPTWAWRDRIGLVLQECELDPLLTVAETLTLFAGFYSHARPVDEVVELVGLRDKRVERVGRLSGGQRRRLDVGVALVGDPELVFLDEPTTGFDPAARSREAWAMIEGLKALGKTVFLTTHYMDEAQHLADRVAILRGRIVAMGPPDQLVDGRESETIVTFRRNAPLDLEAFGTRLGAAPELVGEDVRLRTTDAEVTLGRLLVWADEHAVRLERLEVRRPDLEEIFLGLVGVEPGPDGDGRG